MRTSGETVDAMVEADKVKGSTGEEAFVLASAMEGRAERNRNGPGACDSVSFRDGSGCECVLGGEFLFSDSIPSNFSFALLAASRTFFTSRGVNSA